MWGVSFWVSNHWKLREQLDEKVKHSLLSKVELSVGGCVGLLRVLPRKRGGEGGVSI